MFSIKSRIAQVMKMTGIVAVVAAFAVASFPTNSSAAPASVSGNYGKALVMVYDASTPTAVANPVAVADATVMVANSAGAVVLKGTTAQDGKITLALPKGIYKVTVAANGFESTSVEVVVNAGTATEVAVGLHRIPSTISPTDK